jgi:hypothetical protein
MPYELEGRMHEVCSCQTFCPCWAGLDPDGGECHFSWIFHFDRGTVNGVDVSGLNMGFLGHLPGNVFQGNVRLKVIVDEKCREDQEQALLGAFTGQFGGPLADLAGLVGEVVGVEHAPIEFDVAKGSGSFRAGGFFEGEVEAYRSPSGAPTTLTGTALGPVLGETAYASRVARYETPKAADGLYVIPGGSTQTDFRYVHA